MKDGKKCFLGKKGKYIILLILGVLILSWGIFYLTRKPVNESIPSETEKSEEDVPEDQIESDVEVDYVSLEESIELISGNNLNIKIEDDLESLNQFLVERMTNSEFPPYEYFDDFDSMIDHYLRTLGQVRVSSLESNYPETVEVDNYEYKYIFKIDGSQLNGSGIGTVYWQYPRFPVHGYNSSRIVFYANDNLDNSISGEFTEQSDQRIVYCIFDLSKLFTEAEGFLVFDFGELDGRIDNCRMLNELDSFELIVI
jgi:hypothetical protein